MTLAPKPDPETLNPVQPHTSDYWQADVVQGPGLRDYLDFLIRRKWILLFVFAAIFGLGTLYTFTRKPTFTAVSKLVVVTKGGTSGGDDSMLATLAGLTQGRNVGTQVEILSSPDLLEEAYQKLTPEERFKGFQSAHLPHSAYQIDNKRDTDVITVTVTALDRGAAASLANHISETYLERDLSRNNQATRQARVYVEKELARSKKELAEATSKLAAYKRATGLVSPSTQLDQATQRLFALRSASETASSDHDASAKRLALLRSQLASSGGDVPFATTVQQNPLFGQIAAGISDLQAKRTELVQDFAPGSPEVRAIDARIASEKKRLEQTSSTIVGSSVRQRNPIKDTLAAAYSIEIATEASAAIRLHAAQAALVQAQREMAQYPAKERDLADRMQDVEVLKGTYDMLSQKYYALLISEQSNLPNGMIAAQAHAPLSPSYPKVMQSLVLAGLLGVLGALGVALGIERMDTRLHDPKSAERLTGLTTLSAVPETTHGETDRPLIGANVQHNHAFLESYRILRNNIGFASPDAPIRMLAISSPGRGEGKSTTAINLAISMAMDGKRVLLIDGDLRRPSLHASLNVPRTSGLSSVVTGRSKLAEAIVPTEYENVYLLPSGPLPPNPTEFLNSQQCRRVFEEARDLYDIVIVDSPPCSGLSDMQVISTLVEGVALVIALDTTQKPQLQATLQTLWQASTPLIGLILNRVELRRPGYGYYYSYYYYYYYGYEEGAEPVRKKRHSRRSKPTETPSALTGGPRDGA